MSKEEQIAFFEKILSEVKVKFNNGVIIGFTPFKVCASMPGKYNLCNYTTGNKMEFRFEHEFRNDVNNNMEYLKEANFDIKNIKLNEDL